LAAQTDEGKPRLLVLSTTYPRWPDDHEPGFVHELAKRLVDAFDVVVVAPHAPGAKQREELDGITIVRFRYAPERLESLAYGGGIGSNLKSSKWKYLLLQSFMLSYFLTALSIVLKQRIKVVHAHWMIPGGMIGAALKILFQKLHVLTTAHGADVFQLKGELFAKLRRWVASEVDAVTVVGSSLMTRAEEEGWKDNKVSIVPMGVDLKHTFVPRPQTHPHPTLVFAGRLVEKKGARFLIDAMPKVLESIPDCRLSIAGHGPLYDSLVALASERNVQQRVEFLGTYLSKDLPAIFGCADVAVLPFVETADGDEEGLGLTTVEAMGCGLPVIVGDVAAVRDVVINGQNGRIVRPRVPGELADTILELLSKPEQAKRLRENGRRAVLARFDWSAVSQRYQELLKSVSR
jgi:glycosyltransferase involved in cell wall biosynthesis